MAPDDSQEISARSQALSSSITAISKAASDSASGVLIGLGATIGSVAAGWTFADTILVPRQDVPIADVIGILVLAMVAVVCGSLLRLYKLKRIMDNAQALAMTGRIVLEESGKAVADLTTAGSKVVDAAKQLGEGAKD